MDTLLSQLKQKNPDLKESEIEGLLQIIKQNKGIENTELIRQTGLTKETLKQFKSSISEYLDDSDKSRLVLSAIGKQNLSEYNFKEHSWALLEYNNLELAKQFEDVRKKYGLGYDVAKREYDQFFATPSSSLSKTQLLKTKGLDKNLKIASIGDDDLLTVALNLHQIAYSELKIFEIDQNLITTIKRIIDDLSIKNAHIELYDARQLNNKQNLGN